MNNLHRGLAQANLPPQLVKEIEANGHAFRNMD